MARCFLLVISLSVFSLNSWAAEIQTSQPADESEDIGPAERPHPTRVEEVGDFTGVLRSGRMTEEQIKRALTGGMGLGALTRAISEIEENPNDKYIPDLILAIKLGWLREKFEADIFNILHLFPEKVSAYSADLIDFELSAKPRNHEIIELLSVLNIDEKGWGKLKSALAKSGEERGSAVYLIAKLPKGIQRFKAEIGAMLSSSDNAAIETALKMLTFSSYDHSCVSKQLFELLFRVDHDDTLKFEQIRDLITQEVVEVVVDLVIQKLKSGAHEEKNRVFEVLSHLVSEGSPLFPDVLVKELSSLAREGSAEALGALPRDSLDWDMVYAFSNQALQAGNTNFLEKLGKIVEQHNKEETQKKWDLSGLVYPMLFGTRIKKINALRFIAASGMYSDRLMRRAEALLDEPEFQEVAVSAIYYSSPKLPRRIVEKFARILVSDKSNEKVRNCALTACLKNPETAYYSTLIIADRLNQLRRQTVDRKLTPDSPEMLELKRIEGLYFNVQEFRYDIFKERADPNPDPNRLSGPELISRVQTDEALKLASKIDEVPSDCRLF